MTDLNISTGEAAKLVGNYLERTEEGSVEVMLGANVGPSIQLGGADTTISGSVSAGGCLGMILDRDLKEPELIVREMPRLTDSLGHLLKLDIDKIRDDVGNAIEIKTEYQTISAGLATRVEGQFGEGSRLNLQPGIYVKQTKATLKTRGFDVLDAGVWERWAATGPAFRSVASSAGGEEVTFGWFASVGGGFFVRKELDLVVTASLAFALYGDGLFEITPTVGLQGNF